MIHFRFRHYETEINSSFMVTNCGETDNLEQYMIGDQVVIRFSISPEMARVINEMIPTREDVVPYSESGTIGLDNDEWGIHMKFRVVARGHMLAWKSTGHLNSRTVQVTLEAVNGWWEDVFLWVCLDQKPAWASY